VKLNRLPHRNAAHPIALDQLALGGQLAHRRHAAVGQKLEQPVLHLLVQRSNVFAADGVHLAPAALLIRCIASPIPPAREIRPHLPAKNRTGHSMPTQYDWI